MLVYLVNRDFVYKTIRLSRSLKIYLKKSLGFTGKDCDRVIVPCEHNPCQNDAICLLEYNQPVCYCVPDYHGILCELKYDDCESKFAKCENRGTCIDGINNFTCSCPAQFDGEMCNEYIGFSSPSLSSEITTESLQTSVESSTSKENIFIQSSTSSTFTTDYSESREIPLEGAIYPITNLTTIDSRINSTTLSSLITIVENLSKATGILNDTAHSLHSSSTVASPTNVSLKKVPRWPLDVQKKIPGHFPVSKQVSRFLNVQAQTFKTKQLII